jgi:DNA-directed RNA polymerase subunit beta'
VPSGYSIFVKDGQEVEVGHVLTEGQYELQELFRLRDQDAVMRYLLKEVLAIYASQGQKLNAKHIEVIIRQMFLRVLVKDAGDTELLPGQIVDRYRAETENKRILELGKGEVATDSSRLFMGITKVALSTESFLSAASFMETARVLIDAAVNGKIDRSKVSKKTSSSVASLLLEPVSVRISLVMNQLQTQPRLQKMSLTQ